MDATDPIRIGYTPGQDITLDHLQDQIEWYDRKSGSNQKAFKYLAARGGGLCLRPFRSKESRRHERNPGGKRDVAPNIESVAHKIIGNPLGSRAI